MKTLLTDATIVDDGHACHGHLVIEDDIISGIYKETKAPCGDYDRRIDASGCFAIPGVIDSHVHFREPGLTAKADIESESRAAAYGGVTTYFDMPNTVPQTVTLEALDDKLRRAREKSHVNYAFFFGATNDNGSLFDKLDPKRIPGIKLFMGSSTGNMLVDREETLRQLFRTVSLPIVAHCEDTAVINRNMADAVSRFGDDPPVYLHPSIRSAEACYASSSLAVSLAREYGARLHVAHLSTARELDLLDRFEGHHMPQVTGEAVIAHLMFCDEDYQRLGTKIKCNPAVKTRADREALRAALTDGRITTVATDHAPHLLQDKEGGCRRAASGMPMVQFSLPSMLELADEGVLSIAQVVRLMCHNPALLFGVERRGFLREGYQADVVVVRRVSPYTVTEEMVQSRCGWSPMVGHRFHWRVEHTFCNGRHVYDEGRFDDNIRGEEVSFSH
ncbi:MAG: dihydroorotase [Prevotella sp.]|nr:dihydroorotase [Prevotella sp.]